DRDLSLGSASQHLTWRGKQTKSLIAYWRKRPVEEHKDIKSLFGDAYVNHRSDGSQADVFYQQDRNRVLGLALPRAKPMRSGFRNAGYRFWISWCDEADEMRLGGRRIERLPAELAGDGVFALRDGSVYLAICPVPLADATRPTAVRVAMSTGDVPRLVVSLVSHEGETVRRAEKDAPLYHGFCMELANAEDYASFDEFCDAARRSGPGVRLDGNEVEVRAWEGTDREMVMRVDGAGRRITSRRLAGRRPREGLMRSPTVLMDRSGRQALGGAELTTAEGVPGLLWADPDEEVYVGMNPTADASAFRLATPSGDVRVGTLGFGRVELTGGPRPRCDVLAVTLGGMLTVAGAPEGTVVTVNGVDVTARCGVTEAGGTRKLTYSLGNR
ncbi:MAG: hypothetical protein ACYS9X_21575, partial [Planctomycetota bacterium]